MILIVLYAFGIWTIAWRYRRRWPAFAAIVAGVPPLILSAKFDVWLVKTIFNEDASWLITMAGFFSAILTVIGLLLALQPREKPAHICAVCDYDMRGIGERTCPECGAELDEKEPRRKPIAPELPVEPGASLAIQLADKRRLRSRESKTLSIVTSTPPTSAETPMNNQ